MSNQDSLRAMALRLSDVEEGTACKGTAVESTTFSTRKKAFLFLDAKNARLKLSASEAEAKELAAREPDRYRVGAHGWVTISLAAGPPPRERMERWISESHRGYAAPTAAKKKNAKG